MYGQDDLSAYLNRLFEMQDNPQAVREALSKISIEQVEAAPDSVQFDYYYLSAGIDAMEDKHTPKTMENLLKAKQICETSLGIFRYGYLEIVNAIGDEYLELGDYDQAQSFYQEGIIKGLYQRNADADNFAKLHTSLIDIYIKKGWDKEVVQLCCDAWDFWDKSASPFEAYNYWPIWRLYHYQIEEKQYDNALNNIQFAEDFILHQTDGKNSGYIDLLYDKGYTLDMLGKYEFAAEAYQKAIEICKEIDYHEKMDYLYGNLIASLCNHGDTARLNATLNETYSYARDNDMKLYSNSLFHCCGVFQELRKYDIAGKYASMLPPLYQDGFLSPKEIEVCNNRIKSIEIRKENTTRLQELKKDSLHYVVGSKEWIDYQNNLANAYYVDQQKDIAVNIITKIIQNYLEHGDNKSEAFSYAINQVVNTAQEIEDNETMLKYGEYRLEVTKEKYGANSNEFGIVVNQQLTAALRTNNVEESMQMAGLTKQLLDVTYKDNLSYIYALHNIGRALQISGNINEAKIYYEQSIDYSKKQGLEILDKTTRYLSEVNELLKEQL